MKSLCHQRHWTASLAKHHTRRGWPCGRGELVMNEYCSPKTLHIAFWGTAYVMQRGHALPGSGSMAGRTPGTGYSGCHAEHHGPGVVQVLGQTFVKCIDRSNTTVPEGIMEAARETDTDVLVMGISGYG